VTDAELATLRRIHATALTHHAIGYTLLRTTGATRVSITLPGLDVADANRLLDALGATHRAATHAPGHIAHQSAVVDGVTVVVKHVPRPVGVASTGREGAA
jgi:hypothetical protein